MLYPVRSLSDIRIKVTLPMYRAKRVTSIKQLIDESDEGSVRVNNKRWIEEAEDYQWILMMNSSAFLSAASHSITGNGLVLTESGYYTSVWGTAGFVQRSHTQITDVFFHGIRYPY